MYITFPLILDGAMGTQLIRRGLEPDDCPEKWSLEHPDAVKEIQAAYVAAGSQIIYAPTFGANGAMLERHGIYGKVREYNVRLVALSREIAGPRTLIAGDISGTGGVLYPLGDMSFEDFYDIYLEQAAALEEAGVDLYVIETMTNIPEARAALLAVKAVSNKPVFVSFTCDENGRTMMGTDVCAALEIMQGMGADAFGLNCSTGPDKMIPQMERLKKLAHIPLMAKPNAGLPETVNGKTVYNVGPGEFASYIPALAEAGVSVFGSCCGSDENYISGIRGALGSVKLSDPVPVSMSLLPCATEKNVFLLDPGVTCSTVLQCDEDLEDNIYELDEGELAGIEIRSLQDVAAFTDIQYAIKNPLCLICDDAILLEKALRAYQGRALYEGSLSEPVLLELSQKYGLIF